MSLLDQFERYPLTFGKTAIERLPRLTEAIGADVEFYAKREDCNSGLAFGGNKLRKLEYIVPDAIACDADTLLSIGGGDGSKNRHEMRCDPGKMGAALRRCLRPRGQHHDDPADGGGQPFGR